MASSVLVSPYRIAKEFLIFKLTLLYRLRSTILIALGILSAGFGLQGFLLPSHFIDGGVVGISLMVNSTTGFSLSILLVLLNLPFIVIGYHQFGKAFALKSVLAIIGLALAVAMVQYPVVTSDKLLVASFGGIFLGAGIGLVMRGGAVIDGTEILAIYLGKKSGLTVGDVILLFNIVIFATAAYILTPEAAMYSMLTYFAASKMVDFIVEGIEEYIGVTIISTHHAEIQDMIVQKMKRGITVYSGTGGHGKTGPQAHQREILFSVVTRIELASLKAEVEKIDPNAFIVLTNVLDAKGGMMKKRALK
jgi:uncharacterized membrane-anchored protein YitT (DUF2179 family)